MEIRENIQQAVRGYLERNGERYIPNFSQLSPEEKEHIINIGTGIICTRDHVGYPGGSFVQAIVKNNLLDSFTYADEINQKAIHFYVMMAYNMAYFNR